MQLVLEQCLDDFFVLTNNTKQISKVLSYLKCFLYNYTAFNALYLNNK